MAKRKPPAAAAAAAEPHDPTRLSPDALAKLLTKAGGAPIDAACVRRDLAGGAPRNPDGTVHLIHFTAWLAGRVP